MASTVSSNDRSINRWNASTAHFDVVLLENLNIDTLWSRTIVRRKATSPSWSLCPHLAEHMIPTTYSPR
jgi:hypothetical protein